MDIKLCNHRMVSLNTHVLPADKCNYYNKAITISINLIIYLITQNTDQNNNYFFLLLS